MGKTKRPKPPLKYHGGKHYLADRIVRLMPPHLVYCEPYAGGLSVLLAKNPEGVSEVVSDLNGELSNFWLCLQDSIAFGIMRRQLEATPFSEDEWKRSAEVRPFPAPVDRALAFFVRCRQSLAGRMDNFTGVTKTRTRRGMNNEVSAWLTAVEGLPAVHARLKRVMILNRPALDVIRCQDGPQTLFYLDPPYLHETRVTTEDYAHEMTKAQHIELLGALSAIDGKFLLSGYRSELYDSAAESYGWTRHDFDLPNNASGAKEKRRMTESLWCNFDPPEPKDSDEHGILDRAG
jgi:DNA adenine methylase